jgi:hypothetical protein
LIDGAGKLVAVQEQDLQRPRQLGQVNVALQLVAVDSEHAQRRGQRGKENESRKLAFSKPHHVGMTLGRHHDALPLRKRRRQRPGQIVDAQERDDQRQRRRVNMLHRWHERDRKRLALQRASDRRLIGAAREVVSKCARQRPVAHAHLRHALARRRIEASEVGERAHAAGGEQADALQRRERRGERVERAVHRRKARWLAGGVRVRVLAWSCETFDLRTSRRAIRSQRREETGGRDAMRIQLVNSTPRTICVFSRLK